MTRNLFNFETLDEAEARERENRGLREKEELTPCIICGVKPIIKDGQFGTTSGYKIIRCPVCGYKVGTFYDPIGHWNDCNRLEFRNLEKEKGEQKDGKK